MSWMMESPAAVVATAVAVAVVAWRALGRGTMRAGDGRVVCITGCDSGFGRMLADKCLERGFKVVAACLTEEGAGRYDAIEGATAVAADLTTPEGRKRLTDAALHAAEDGGEGLFALVNNAGRNTPGLVELAPPLWYERTMAINFHAPVALTHALLPALKRTEGGRVLNVTSTGGFLNLTSLAPYNASKHALESFSDTLRVEMRPWGLRVVVVEPSGMDTALGRSYPDQWLESFQLAPPERRADYGDEWAGDVHRGMTEMVPKALEDPKLTVDALLRGLQLDRPPTRMVTGKIGRFVWVPMSYLPTSISDYILYQISLGTVGLPKALDKKSSK